MANSAWAPPAGKQIRQQLSTRVSVIELNAALDTPDALQNAIAYGADAAGWLDLREHPLVEIVLVNDDGVDALTMRLYSSPVKDAAERKQIGSDLVSAAGVTDRFVQDLISTRWVQVTIQGAAAAAVGKLRLTARSR